MRRWTDEEWQRTKALLDEGIDRHVVAHRIGRAFGCLKEKIRWEGLNSEQRASKLEGMRLKRRAVKESIYGPDAPRAPKRQTISAYVCERAAADRDARKIIPPRDLSAAFFGDPLPGYSALDKR